MSIKSQTNNRHRQQTTNKQTFFLQQFQSPRGPKRVETNKIGQPNQCGGTLITPVKVTPKPAIGYIGGEEGGSEPQVHYVSAEALATRHAALLYSHVGKKKIAKKFKVANFLKILIQVPLTESFLLFCLHSKLVSLKNL